MQNKHPASVAHYFSSYYKLIPIHRARDQYDIHSICSKSLSRQKILFHVFLAHSFTLLVNATTKPLRMGKGNSGKEWEMCCH